MFRRVSPLCRNKEPDVLVFLPKKRPSRCSPCGSSPSLTTTRPFTVVGTRDNTDIRKMSESRRKKRRLPLRKVSLVPSSLRPFSAVETRDSTDTKTSETMPIRNASMVSSSLHPKELSFGNTRCVHLVTPERKASGATGGSIFTDRIVSVSGFIKSIRKQKQHAFAHITDGSCLQPMQVVLDPKDATLLNNGTSLRVRGKWRPSPAQGQSYELIAEEVHIYGTTDAKKYPIQKKDHTPEFLRTVPHLRLRTPFNSMLARFRSSCLAYLNTYLPKLEQSGGLFVQVQPPIITTSDCEGAGQVFGVVSNAAAVPRSEQALEQNATPNPLPFFREPKYLTVSSQLHLEAFAAELRHVWAWSPAFRAEKSDTPRHLAEFYMLEMELSYVSDLRTLMSLVEHIIRSLARNLISTPLYQELLSAVRGAHGSSGESRVEEVQNRWNVLFGGPWESASYTYCMKRLGEAAKADATVFERYPEYTSGLQVEHERWIVKHIGQGRPIFVTHYPKAIKPFYMASSLLATDHIAHPDARSEGINHATFENSETGEDTVACFDLLMPFGGGEMAGGSLREHRLEYLIQNMREDGMLKPKAASSSSSSVPASHVSDVAKESDDIYPFLQAGESLGPLKWYADLRRYGTMPHGGFGIGWDRLLAYLTGVPNLRDVVPFPRSFGKADC